MTINRRYLGWGIFLIALGIVPLAVQLGWIDAKTAASVLRLWPLILVGIGLSLVLRMTRYRVIGSALSAAVFGLVVGVFFAGGLASPAFLCTGSQPSAAPVTQTGAFSGAAANVNIELSCGEINLTRGADPGWSVGVATDGAYPVVLADATSLDLRSANSRLVGPFPGGTDEHWQVTLPATTTVGAGVTLNAASGRLAFGNGAVSHVSATYNGADSTLDLRGATGDSSVSATLNASSVRLLLPDTTVEASVTLNVSSMTVCLPPSAGLRVEYSNTIGTDNFAAAGLAGSGENWSTPGIGAAVSELHVTSNLSSITLDRSGECQ
jgi:hypothetical protein